METKICCRCKIEQNISEYTKLKRTKDGLNNSCKTCVKKKSAIYYLNNKDKVVVQCRRWMKKNRDKVQAASKRFRDKNPEKIKEINRRSKEKNKEKIKLRLREWREKNKEHIKEYKKIHRKKYKERNIELRAIRRKTDSLYNLTNAVRCRINEYVKKLDIIKRNKTFDIVGCTPQELKEHLESQFKDGMSWENRNEWHIDHIIPLCSATTEEEMYKLCHYTNLQPLWATENIKKGGKIL
jgi:hypothetical protein